MGLKRALALAVLGSLLFATLASANVLLAADRTVLDADYVKETADEADLYAAIDDQIEQQFVGENSTDGDGTDGGEAGEGRGGGPLGISQAELFSEAVTEQYVRSQFEANVDRVYAYLHGERDDLRVAIDNEPLKENIVAEVEAETENIDLGEAGIPQGEQIEAMAESEDEFRSQREQFRAEQKERIQERTDEELSDAELERRLDENMDRIRQEMYDRMESGLEGQFDGDGPEAAMEEPVRRLLSARIDALTGELTYEEYVAEVEAGKAELGDAFAAGVESTLDENMDDETVLTDELGEEEMEAAETARTAVQAASVLVYALPLFALVLIGLIARVAPPATAALQVGTTAALVGGLGVGGARFGREQLPMVLADTDMPGPAADFVLALAGGVLGTLGAQSAVLLVGGAVLIAAGIALRLELLPRPSG